MLLQNDCYRNYTKKHLFLTQPKPYKNLDKLCFYSGKKKQKKHTTTSIYNGFV